MIRPAALVIGFGLTLLAGKAANIVAGSGLKPTVFASGEVSQLLPPQPTACDWGFAAQWSNGNAGCATATTACNDTERSSRTRLPGGESVAEDPRSESSAGLSLSFSSGGPAAEAVGLLSVGKHLQEFCDGKGYRGAGAEDAEAERHQHAGSRKGRCNDEAWAGDRGVEPSGSVDAGGDSADLLGQAVSRVSGGGRQDLPDSRRLIDAIIRVESSGRADAVGDGGRAVGILQIWPITVADANRILGRDEFTLADRLDPDRSRAIFYTITNHYSAGCSDEIKAKRWCNGPRGEHKPGSAAYWAKVQEAMRCTK